MFHSHYLGCQPLCRRHRPASPQRPRAITPPHQPCALSLATLLPPDAIGAIAMACADVSGLAWCATCVSFRAARPPLRVLVVGERSGAEATGGWDDGAAATLRERVRARQQDEHGLLVCVSAHDGALAHRTLAAVSATHAAEVTHLYIASWRSGGCDLLPSQLPAHGRRFRCLRSLAVAHQTRGTPCPAEPTPAACVKQLVRATAGSLRELSIDAPVFFDVGDALEILPDLGARLQALRLLLVPSFVPAALEAELEMGGRPIAHQEQPGGSVPVHQLDDEECREFLRWRRDHELMEEAQGAGHEEETEYLRTCVHGLCVSLLQPCLLYTSPSPRDRQKSRMPSSA